MLIAGTVHILQVPHQTQILHADVNVGVEYQILVVIIYYRPLFLHFLPYILRDNRDF